jgi:hypothetical protein
MESAHPAVVVSLDVVQPTARLEDVIPAAVGRPFLAIAELPRLAVALD